MPDLIPTAPPLDLMPGPSAAALGVTLRVARPEDHAAIDRLLSRAYPALLAADYERTLLNDIMPFLARANPRLLTSGSYYVAEDSKGQLLGAGGWSWMGAQGGVGPIDMAHIRHVVTHQDHTRRGIGGMLMRHALEQARAAGARLFNCQSTLTAAPFYSALGFETVGEIAIHLCPGLSFPAVHMRRVG